MASVRQSLKAKAKAVNSRKLRVSSRAKEYYSGFAENVRENYIPRFLHIDNLIYGTQDEPKQNTAHS